MQWVLIAVTAALWALWAVTAPLAVDDIGTYNAHNAAVSAINAAYIKYTFACPTMPYANGAWASRGYGNVIQTFAKFFHPINPRKLDSQTKKFPIKL